MKTTKQICKDNEVSWYDGYHTKWFSEKELRDKISATTIKSSRYGHEGYIDAELLKIALFGDDK